MYYDQKDTFWISITIICYHFDYFEVKIVMFMQCMYMYTFGTEPCTKLSLHFKMSSQL